LDGESSLEEAVAQGVAASRQLAKRQLTWLRKWPGLYWMLTDATGNVCAAGQSEHGEAIASEIPLRVALNYVRHPPYRE
ncbi:MAG: tRNA (adenosine(37)-N6)-dimethylallyltransferase MiaA, partial [Haliea sp.]